MYENIVQGPYISMILINSRCMLTSTMERWIHADYVCWQEILSILHKP